MAELSPPSRPTSSRSRSSPRPDFSRNSSSFGSFMTLTNLERYGEDWAGAMTLLDVIETFFDSRLDLYGRRLKAQSHRLKSRAVELLPKGLRTPAGGGILLVEDDIAYNKQGGGEGSRDVRDRADSGSGSKESAERKYRKEVEREVERIKVKLAAKVTHLSGTWRSAQVVRTKEKASFFFGVMSLAFTCLLYGMAPEWMPFAYTVQSAFYLPVRAYTYKRKAWHYFLFGELAVSQSPETQADNNDLQSDLCYFVNALDLLWIWVFPSSTVLFICCYLLTLGPLASAIITWRNSLVFHSMDKVTSMFIHIYPPIVLTIIRHVYPNAEDRYTGLKHVDDYKWYTMILLSGVPYILWQAAYYKFISIDRKSKIESGQRENSFHYMLNDKRGPIGKALQGIRPEHREQWFIFGQLIYSIIFMIPPAALYIHSPRSSSVFLITIFAVSVWNGASFYVEVFGRKFERELERLRKEMELASATGSTTSTSSTAPPSPPSPSYTDAQGEDDGDHEHYLTDTADALANSPLVLPGTNQSASELEVPEMVLDQAQEEIASDGGNTLRARSKA
ncbi:hypothetical protein IAR55_000144 [Kwoniella newhampshirensis]|uniref:Glycerophosphocholine acyltransferase 1 n=1 Tax=Kwoniella newhampshirensis TaxID=1651941 RepID=A0AAW0Z5T6_9TREE